MSDAAKAVLRGNFIALRAYIRKEERSKISNLCFHLRKMGRGGWGKSNLILSKHKKRNHKIKVGINDIENRKSIKKTQ